MENYVKVFELFDRRSNVFKNASINKIEGQSSQPYTQTINYFFTFEEAKKKIISIWNFSTPQLNKKIDKNLEPSLVKKFGDKLKDKLKFNKVKESKSLLSLGITEDKESTQLFYYNYKGLRIAKIEFDKTKVHNRSWKLTFYYYEGINDNERIPGIITNDNKKKEENIPGDIKNNTDEENIPGDIKNNTEENKKDIIVPFIDNSKKALDFIKKHLDYIYKSGDNEIEIGDMKVIKNSNKKFFIKTNNRDIEVNNPSVIKGLEYVFDYQKPSDSKKLGNKEEPTKVNQEKSSNQKQIEDKEEKVSKFDEFEKKNTPEMEFLNKLLDLKDNIDDNNYLKVQRAYRRLVHPDKLGKVIEEKDKQGKVSTKTIYSKLDYEIISIYKETEEILGNKLLKDSDKKNRIKGDLNKIIKIVKKEVE